MNIDRENIAFTGHREYDNEHFAEALLSLVIRSEGSTLLSGMAVGFDLAAAEAVLALRDEGRDLRLTCVVPYRAQSEHFSESDRSRYNDILQRADDVVVLAEEYSIDIFRRRNDYLVDHADRLIAYYNGGGSGGTAYTVKRAKRKKIAVKNIYPQQQLSLFCED